MQYPANQVPPVQLCLVLSRHCPSLFFWHFESLAIIAEREESCRTIQYFIIIQHLQCAVHPASYLPGDDNKCDPERENLAVLTIAAQTANVIHIRVTFIVVTSNLDDQADTRVDQIMGWTSS